MRRIKKKDFIFNRELAIGTQKETFGSCVDKI